MNELVEDNVNMGRRDGEKVTSSDVWKFILDHLKMLLVVSPVLTAIMLMLWNTYAQPKVDITVKKETEPLKLEVSKIKNSQKLTEFNTTQILAIVKKTSDPKIVNQVINETNDFRPKPDNTYTREEDN